MATAERKETSFSLINVGPLELEADRVPFYTGLVVSGKMLMVTNDMSLNVQLYRRHDGKLMAASDQLESYPRGICLINDKEICVFLENRIEIMSVLYTGDTGAIRRSRTIYVNTVFDFCQGVVGFMDKVVVSGVKADAICWCVVSLEDGHIDKIHQICKGNYWSHLTAKSNMVYISCFAVSPDACVHGYDIRNPSKPTFLYKHKDLRYPSGITVDVKGFIFVCNMYPPCIHHLTDQCVFVTIYREGIPWHPQAIFCDREILYVTSRWSKIITRYKPEYSHQQDDIGDSSEETDTVSTNPILIPTLQRASTSQCRPKAIPIQSEQQLSPVRSQPTPFVAAEKHRKVTERRKTKGEELFKSPSGLTPPQKKQKTNWDLEQDTKVLEHLRNKDFQGIENILRQHIIPAKKIMITAVKELGYNSSVQHLLREISNMLKKAIPYSTSTWCGFRPREPDCPVFVVTFKNQKCILDSEEMLKSFSDYSIIVRYKNVPNDEERTILEKTGQKIIRAEDAANAHSCIAKHTELLMKEHSNLSIIRAHPMKARGYLNKELELAEETCIVLSVPVKGIIPIGEKEFPKYIDGIVTDVREGELVFFGRHEAMSYHHELRMGCSIARQEVGSYGTLGGFVDLPGNKVGCLTAAHVLLTNDEIQHYIQLDDESKTSQNMRLRNGELKLDVYQPQASLSVKSFGQVHTIALRQGNIFEPSVDAAIIAVTDEERKPVTGNFPEGDFLDIGFTKIEPMQYTSGEILDDISEFHRGCSAIKFGSTTGITCGNLRWNGTSAREVEVWGNYCFPSLVGQMEVTSLNFANMGDSGALVFLCLGGNANNLCAIGMVIGGSSTSCSTIITPIKAIFKRHGLSEKRFKVFPTRIFGNDLQQFMQVEDPTHGDLSAKPADTLRNLSGRITTLEQNMNKRFEIFENNLCQELSRVRADVNESITDNMDKGFKMMKELLLKKPDGNT